MPPLTNQFKEFLKGDTGKLKDTGEVFIIRKISAKGLISIMNKKDESLQVKEHEIVK